MNEFWNQFFPNLSGTISGGIVLSFFFFLTKEWFFSLPQISGSWEVRLITDKSDYNPYQGMTLLYKVTLLQSGSVLTGVGELDQECAANGNRSYYNKGRRPIEITGTIEKRITRSDIIRIMWSEQGERRKFSNIFLLKVSGSKTDGDLSGGYSSTAANSKGYSEWRRNL